MEAGGRVDQHVARLPTPGILQHQSVRREIVVGEHRPLGAPGRSRGVEDRREVVRSARDRLEFGGLAFEIVKGAVAGREDQSRFGVLDEPSQLDGCIGGVERDVDQPGLEAGQIEQGAFDRLFRLDEDSLPGPSAKPSQRRGIAADRTVQLGIGQPNPVAFDEGRPVPRRLGGRGKQAVEIPGQTAAFSRSTRSVFSQLNRSPSALRPKWP